MRGWMKWKLATWTAIGLIAALGGAGCAVLIEGDPDNEAAGSTGAGGAGGSTGAGAIDPACSAIDINNDASFAPTSGPSGARFTAVAATSSVVLASTGIGLHRSNDGGDTWAFLEAAEVRDATISAIAALGSEVFVSAGGVAVYRTQDGGDTWQDVSSTDCTAPSYLSARGSDLYALADGRPFHWNSATETWDPLPAGEQAFDVIESDGVALYANSLYVTGVFRLELGAPGAAWTRVEDLPAWGYKAFAFFDDGHAFAASGAQVFRSNNGGATFAPLPLGESVNVADLLVADGALYMSTDTGIWVSPDRGDTWAKTPLSAQPSGFALAKRGDQIFAAADGLRRTSGKGGAWEKLHILADAVQALSATATSVLSASESGFLRTTDGGGAWNPIEFQGDVGFMYNSPPVLRDGKIFALGALGSILVSNDDGASFHALPAGPLPSGWVNFLSSIDQGLVIGISTGAGAGCQDVQDITTTLYVSADEGQTWTKALNGFPALFTDCYDKSHTPMITGVSQAGDALLATSYHNGAFRSIDGGGTWEPIATDETVGALSHFVRVGGAVLAAAQHGGVARSLDSGATWEIRGLGGLPVQSIAAAGGLAVAGASGAEGGVFASSDAGASWRRVDEAFTTSVSALAIRGDRLFAGTPHRSTWTAELRCADAP